MGEGAKTRAASTRSVADSRRGSVAARVAGSELESLEQTGRRSSGRVPPGNRRDTEATAGLTSSGQVPPGNRRDTGAAAGRRSSGQVRPGNRRDTGAAAGQRSSGQVTPGNRRSSGVSPRNRRSSRIPAGNRRSGGVPAGNRRDTWVSAGREFPVRMLTPEAGVVKILLFPLVLAPVGPKTQYGKYFAKSGRIWAPDPGSPGSWKEPKKHHSQANWKGRKSLLHRPWLPRAPRGRQWQPASTSRISRKSWGKFCESPALRKGYSGDADLGQELQDPPGRPHWKPPEVPSRVVKYPE